MNIYELSKNRRIGNLYFDDATNTLYRTSFTPPSEEKMRPPYFFVLLLFYITIVVCFSVLGMKSIPNTYFYFVDIIWIMAIGAIVYFHQLKLSKVIEKGNIIDLTKIDENDYKKLISAIERSTMIMYFSVNRFLGAFYFIGLSSFVSAIFSSGEYSTQLIHTGIITFVYILYIKVCSCCKKRKKIYKSLLNNTIV